MTKKTIIDGKEIKLFNGNDIAKIYTSKVKEFLDDGYNFYFYSGSQGEDCKTCLTKDNGKTVFIIFVDTEHQEFNNIKVIYVKKYEDVYAGETLWLNKGETISKKEFYCVSDRKRDNNLFVENKEEFEIIKKIQQERSRNRWDMEDINTVTQLSEKCYKVALKTIRKRRGCKSIQVKDIKEITHRIGYGYSFDLGNYDKNFSIKLVK